MCVCVSVGDTLGSFDLNNLVSSLQVQLQVQIVNIRGDTAFSLEDLHGLLVSMRRAPQSALRRQT